MVKFLPTVSTDERLMREWPRNADGSISTEPHDPHKLTLGSHKEPLWKCAECRNEWATRIIHRSNGNGCTYCSGYGVHSDGRNSLAMMNPEIAAEFHPTGNGDLTPETLTFGSNKKVWWLCSTCDYEWETWVKHRTTRKHGCPCCSNIVVHPNGLNSLRTTNPKLAAELHPTKNGEWNADNLTEGMNKKLWWVCNKWGVGDVGQIH